MHVSVKCLAVQAAIDVYHMSDISYLNKYKGRNILEIMHLMHLQLSFWVFFLICAIQYIADHKKNAN